MGYTHYWRGVSRVNAETYQSALQEIRIVIAAAGERVAQQAQWPVWMSAPPVSSEPPVLEQGREILINGNGGREYEHETFWLPHDPVEAIQRDRQRESGWADAQFCKTARKPYDLVVTACLAVLGQFCPEVEIASDGTPEEWRPGCNFASSVLGRIVPCPLAGRETQDVARRDPAPAPGTAGRL